jgi:hypothetical protein
MELLLPAVCYLTPATATCYQLPANGIKKQKKQFSVRTPLLRGSVSRSSDAAPRERSKKFVKADILSLDKREWLLKIQHS